MLVLKSRRFEEQKLDEEAMVRYSGFPVEEGGKPVIEDGNESAVLKGEEVTSDLAQRMRQGYSYEVRRSRDIVDSFLEGLGLTRGEVLAMRGQERSRTVSRLRKVAGIAFHPNNGIKNAPENYVKINNFLEGLDK